MKSFIVLVASLLFSSLGLAKTGQFSNVCLGVTERIEKELGSTGANTKLNKDNYKKALELLNSGFPYPSEAELGRLTKATQKGSMKSEKAIKSMIAGGFSCLSLQKSLVSSLLNFTKSHLSSEEIKREIWDGLNRYFQIKKHNVFIVLLVQTKKFQETVEVFKPNDKALAKELKMFISEMKSSADKVSQDIKALGPENTQDFTPEYYKILLEEDQEARKFQEIFRSIVKSVKL